MHAGSGAARLRQANGTGPTTAQSPLGALSAGFTANPNFAGGGASINCAGLPGPADPTLVAAVRSALTTGVYNPGGCAACPNASAAFTRMRSVTSRSTSRRTARCRCRRTRHYYATSILFDNVLIGDYQQLGPAPTGTTAASFDAGGNAMVHIRAIPEGGPAGTPLTGAQTNLPFTFYDRYTPATNRTLDRRQPLPALWAARYIQGGPGAFRNELQDLA